MKKRSISLIIGLMSAALLGVIGMQYYFIRESYIQKSQLFDLSVNNSLSEVTKKLAKRDAQLFIQRKAQEEELLQNKREREREQRAAKRQAELFAARINEINRKIDIDFKKRDSALRSRFPRIMTVGNDFYNTYIKDPSQRSKVQINVKLQQSIDNGRVFQNEDYSIVAEDADLPKLKKKNTSRTPPDTIYYLVPDPIAGIGIIQMARKNPELVKELQNELKRQEKEKLASFKLKEAEKVNRYFNTVKAGNERSTVPLFQDLANEYEQFEIPLQRRVSQGTVDTLLRSELKTRGIDLAFNYQISLANSDSLIFSRVSEVRGAVNKENTYSTTLFPKEIIHDAGVLTITFPGKNKYVLQNMNVILASSAGLLVVMIGCFAFTILTIYRQKKISEMKTDFINNMTHEFKTPVATIMIASEALRDPEITEDRSRINRLAGIIYDENVRLGNHIERVLNIARIDRGDLKLDFKPVEMNDLIAAITDSMQLQFSKKDAKVHLDLGASRPIVSGDELHLSNVIFNLIDNALKYSKEDPEITISTINSGKNLVIKVKDNGIGMNKDQLSKIFEQFYRIPTGNVHNVKGFGLGLSYVNNIVNRHRGTVKVKSEKDKGSEFEVVFPVI